jgi:hypothetical protein
MLIICLGVVRLVLLCELGTHRAAGVRNFTCQAGTSSTWRCIRMSHEIGHSATFLKLLSAFCGEVAYEKSEGELHKEKEKGKRVKIS